MVEGASGRATPIPLASSALQGSSVEDMTGTGTDKRSYSISEVVALTGLTAHTLRWYERIGLMPHVDRSHTGQRRFRDRDLDWLAFVGKLRLTGMPVADMVRYAELLREGESTFEERQELLEATRRDVISRIAELHDTLAVLDRKIEFYAGARRAPERHRVR
ncbi:MerR family transcriptional regulator [Streptomyces sp. CS149]|nr:MerR family transcriptional regulator [Streptomyces sp. CS149]